MESDPQNPLRGLWRDTYGLIEYHFLDDRNFVLTALGRSSFPGTYSLGNDGTIMIYYAVLGRGQTKTYSFSFAQDRFYLDDNEFIRMV